MVRKLSLLLCGLLFIVVQAQTDVQPTIRLSDLDLMPDEELVITGSNLTPEALYTFTLTGPTDNAIIESFTATSSGELNYGLALGLPGMWKLTVQGEGLEAQFEIRVGDEQDAQTETDRGGVATLPNSTSVIDTQEEQSQETVESDTASNEVANEQQEQAPAENADQIESETPEGAEAERQAEDDREPEGNREITQSTPGLANVQIEDGVIKARRGDRLLWQFGFPAGSGVTRGLSQQQEAVYVGHGNSVLRIENLTGNVLNRWLFPGQIIQLEPQAEDSLRITVAIDSGLTESFTLAEGKLEQPFSFGLRREVFGWLQKEAEVSDPLARLEQDTTNPWLYLKAGLLADDPAIAKRQYDNAVRSGQTFYDLAGVSRVLLEQGQPELADQAFDKAMKNFAARGYDPRLLRNLNLHEIYNFPLRPMQEALEVENLDQAAFWAKWLRYFLSDEVPEIKQTLGAYAELLEQKGQEDEASLWKERLQLDQRADLSMTLESLAQGLGRFGWYIALSLLLAFWALHLTLLAKYWIPQSVNFERRRALKRSVGPISRLFAIRYYSITEKLVLVLLLVLTLTSVSLASWHDNSKVDTSLALDAGNWTMSNAQAYLQDLPLSGERGVFIKAYAAQVAGKSDIAQERYETLASFAPAVNNLAVLTEEADLYQQALALDKALPAARHNAGEKGVLFQEDYVPQAPLLAVPSHDDLEVAIAGNYQDAIVTAFSRPWFAQVDARPHTINQVVWMILLGVFALILAFNLIWLLIPRMRWVNNSPRTLLYNLWSFLIPGSGLADEMWGMFLLVPWAIFGLDALANYASWPFGLDTSLRLDLLILAIIYIINLIAIIVEYSSYRRRMRSLKEDNPDLAREFGLLRS